MGENIRLSDLEDSRPPEVKIQGEVTPTTVGGEKVTPDTKQLQLERTSTQPATNKPNGSMRLGDLESLEKAPVPPETQQVIGISSEDRARFERMKPIGFWEGMRRSDGTKVLAGIGLDAFNLATLGLVNDDIVEVYEKNHLDESGVTGMVILKSIIDKIKSDDYEKEDGKITESGQRSKEANIAHINRYLTSLEEERIRGTTTGFFIGSGISEMPMFMIEFMATGGLATLGKQAAKKAVVGTFKDIANKTTRRFLAKTTLTAVGGVMRTAALPHRSLQTFSRRQIESQLALTEKGITLGNGAAEKPATSAMLAVADTFIEMFSEETGAFFGAGISRTGKLVGKIVPKPKFVPVALGKTFEKVFVKLNPNKKAKDLWTKVGFNGFLEELGEEQLGDILRAVVGVDDFGAEDPDQMLDRVFASIHGSEELMINAGIIAPFSAGRIATSSIVDRLQKRKQELGYEEPLNKILNDKEIDEILEAEPVEEEAVVEEEIPEAEPVEEEIPVAEEVPLTKEEKAKAVDESLTTVAPEVFTEKEGVLEVDQEKLTTELEKQVSAEEATQIVESVTGEKVTVEAKDKLASLIVKGRVDKLLEDETKLNTELDVVEQRLEAKPTAALEKKRESLLSRIGKISERIDNLRLSLAPTPVGPRAKIITTPSKVSAALRQQVSAVQTAAKKELRTGIKVTKQEALASGRAIIDLINKSSLSKAEKSGFINQINRVQTTAQLEKALPAIQKKISGLEVKAATRRELAKAEKSIKRLTKGKKGKKPVGKFPAEFTRIFESIDKISKMPAVEAFTRLNTNLEEIDDILAGAEEQPGRSLEAIKLENGLLGNVSDIKNRSLEDLQAINARLAVLSEAAVLQVRATKEKRQDRNVRNVEKVLADLNGDKPFDPANPPSIKDNAEKIFNNATTLGFSQLSWHNLMDLLSVDSGTEAFQSNLSKFGNVIALEQKEKGDIARDNADFEAREMDAFNFSTRAQVIDQRNEDSKTIDLGLVKDKSGQNIRLRLTASEMRKIMMEVTDPDLRASAFDKRGGYKIGGDGLFGSGGALINGFTLEIEEKIRNHMNQNIGHQRFIDEQLKFYRRLYNKFNTAYAKRYGHDLPFNEFYSPIKRQIGQKKATDTIIDEARYRATVLPNAAKSRTVNYEKIVARSDIDVMLRHVVELNHFLNWQDKLDELNAVFGNIEVRQIMEGKHGRNATRAVDFHIKGFTEGRKKQADFYERNIRGLKANFTVAALAGKINLFPKQLVSVAAYGEFIPAKELAIGIADYFKDIKGHNATLDQTDFFSTRGAHITRDLNDFENTKEHKTILKRIDVAASKARDKAVQAAEGLPLPKGAKQLVDRVGGAEISIADIMLYTTKAGDRAAIAIGGWAVYRYHKEILGKSHAEALEAFVNTSASTQQSSDLSQLTPMQKGGPVMEIAAMFSSSLSQYYQRYLASWRNAAKGRITKQQLAKTILIHQVVLPSIWQWAANMFTIDEDDQLRAIVAGPISGLLIAGDFLNWAITKSLNVFFDKDLPDFGRLGLATDIAPLIDTHKGVAKAMNELDENTIEFEDLLDAAKFFTGETVGPLTGVPFRRVFDSYEGLEDIIDGDILKGTAKLSGYSAKKVERTLK